MAETLFPHLKWEQLWAATLETLYMTALSGVATFVLGIVLGLALFLTARGRIVPQPRGLQRDFNCGERVSFYPVHHSDCAVDPVHENPCRHHSWRQRGAAGSDCRCGTVLRSPGRNCPA